MGSKKVATIVCIDGMYCDQLEPTARLIAARAENAGVGTIFAEVQARGGDFLLLSRAMHYFERRVTLMNTAIAVREADANNPSRPLYEKVPAAPGLGVHPNLIAMGDREHLAVGLAKDSDEAAPDALKLRKGFTYVFPKPEDGVVKVEEFESNSSGVAIVPSKNALSGRGSFATGVDGCMEDVFVKVVDSEDGDIDSLLRDVALEASICATLATFDCFVTIRAVQVLDGCARMAFDLLLGHSVDDLLNAMEATGRRASESQILGGVLLALNSYIRLNAAGFCQRDAKSGNLFMAIADGMLRMVVVDSDACLKVGHIADAFDARSSNEGWQLSALRDRKPYMLGGTSYSKAVSYYTANVDLLSKQCQPGEQAIVYSLSELFLRMMGDNKQLWSSSEASRWDEVLESSVHCNLIPDDEDEATSSLANHYSTEFLHLVMTLRRRSFTQGGVDSFLDLNQARELCLDFITTKLESTRESCMSQFAALVSDMSQFMTNASHSSRGENPNEVSDEWSTLSSEDMENYYVCPVNTWQTCTSGVTFELAGLVMTAKNPAQSSLVELYVRGPHIPNNSTQRACVGSSIWWDRVPHVADVMKQCEGRGDNWKNELVALLDRTVKYPLEVRGDILCCHLRLERDVVFGDIPTWPVVKLYPYSTGLEHAVLVALRAYLD